MRARELGYDALLSALEADNAAELAACVGAHRDHLARWTVVASRVVDEASARRLIADCGGLYFGIWLDGSLCGATLFRVFDVRTRACEIGGWLTPPAEGRGLVTRAFQHMIEWAILDHGMVRVELRTSPENYRGRMIAGRLGMRLDRVLNSAVFLNGIHHDTEVWFIESNRTSASAQRGA